MTLTSVFSGQAERVTMVGERVEGLTVAWHLALPADRELIHQHGIDWRWRSDQRNQRHPELHGPELEVVYLCAQVSDVGFLPRFGVYPHFDVWLVDVTGLVLESQPDGWLIHRQPIPPHRLQLVQENVSMPPVSRRQS